MWSLHLLQTALRFGGNLKMVCGWCGNTECDWSPGRSLQAPGSLWSWLVSLPCNYGLWQIYCLALTFLDKIWSSRSMHFYKKAVFDARPKGYFVVLILRGVFAGVGYICWGWGRPCTALNLPQNIASFILINPKRKGRSSPHLYHHRPSL